MSKGQKKSVSEIVEKCRVKYPQADRKLIRKLILLEHGEINPRTLDRHLAKAFPLSIVSIAKEVVKKPNLEKIGNEMEKVKEDYIQGRRLQAAERMLLLIPILPKDWQKKLEILMTEAEKEMKDMGDKLGIDMKINYAPSIDSVMIPEILIKLNQLIENYEQGQ